MSWIGEKMAEVEQRSIAQENRLNAMQLRLEALERRFSPAQPTDNVVTEEVITDDSVA